MNLNPRTKNVTNIRLREVWGKVTDTAAVGGSGVVAYQYLLITSTALSAMNRGPFAYYSDGSPRPIVGIVPLASNGAAVVTALPTERHPNIDLSDGDIPHQLTINICNPAGNTITLAGTDLLYVQFVIEQDTSPLLARHSS